LDGAYAEIQALKMGRKPGKRLMGLIERLQVRGAQSVSLRAIYKLDHEEELAARAGREKERKKAKKQGAGAVSVPEPSNFVLGEAGPSRIDPHNYS